MTPHRLECIAIPLTVKQLDELHNLLAVWDFCFRMCNDKSASEVVLLITISGEEDPNTRGDIQEALRINNHIGRFRLIRIEFLGIPKVEDIYLRAGDTWNGKCLPRYGRKNGPNQQFFLTMRLCESYNTTLLNETDMYPIKYDWLSLSVAKIANTSHFLVFGGLYRGGLELQPSYERHLNGNAFYATGHTGFKNGLLPAWEKGLAELCSTLDSAAYDIWLAHTYHDLLFHSKDALVDAGYLREISRYYYLSIDGSVIWNACLPGDRLSEDLARALVNIGYLFVHGRGLVEIAVKVIEYS